MACRHGSVQSKSILARDVEGGSVTNRNSGKNSTFCFIALDPDSRFGYPPVSLFFDMACRDTTSNTVVPRGEVVQGKSWSSSAGSKMREVGGHK